MFLRALEEPKPSWELNVARELMLKIDYETGDFPKQFQISALRSIDAIRLRQSRVLNYRGKSFLSVALHSNP